jgi:hypothetical protein
MAGFRPHTWRTRAGSRRENLNPSFIPRSQPRTHLAVGNAGDRLLAPLRRYWVWTALGLLVAAMAAGTRFAAIGVVPPSIKLKPFAHATGSTELVVGRSLSFSHSIPDTTFSKLPPHAYTLADMVASPEVAKYVARAAGLPASKIGIMGPLWTELQRSQQWAPGPKRASQIIVENDPYHITLSVLTESPPWPPIIVVESQAPSTDAAARLAAAVGTGLNAYVQHLQTSTGVPTRGRYQVTQLVPVSVAPGRRSQLASVGAFTFVAVFVLWCGVMLAVASLTRDLRETAAAAEVGEDLDRLSNSGAPAGGDPVTPQPRPIHAL